MRHRLLLIVSLPCIVLAVACGDETFRQGGYTDFRFPASSAGVVHELESSDLDGAPEWRVETDAPLRITGVEEADENQAVFESLSDVLRLPDGRLAAAAGFGARVLIFDHAGEFTDVWGRQGAGPGEFQSATWLGLCGSSGLYVYDLPLQRLTVFSWAGDVVEVVRLQPPGGRGFRRSPECNDAGDFAALGPLMLAAQNPPVGPFRPSVTFWIRTAGSEAFQEVTGVPGPDSYRWPDGGMGPLGDFGRRPHYAMADSTLFVATGDAFEVAEFDTDGDLLSLIVAKDIRRSPVTRADLRRVRREQMEAKPPRVRQRLRQTLTSMWWPRFHPVLDGLLVDSEGCVWARHHQPRRPQQIWYVLSRSGDPVGAVKLPGKFTLTQATDDELVGYAEDQLGVRRVVAYGYERHASSRCR